MRALFSLLMVCLIASPAFAVDKVLIGGDGSHGGYGGLVFKYSKVNGDYRTFVGARGGWVINHVFVVGLAGYGLVDEYDDDWWFYNIDSNLHMGYGGLMLEYIVHPHRLVHLSTSLLIGGGSYGYGSNWLDYDSHHDNFFVLEPEMNMMLNITNYFRMGFGVGYRFIDNDNSLVLDDKDLSGLSLTLTFKFGYPRSRRVMKNAARINSPPRRSVRTRPWLRISAPMIIAANGSDSISTPALCGSTCFMP